MSGYVPFSLSISLFSFQGIIDEEREITSTDSPFKSAIDRIFHDVLVNCGVPMNTIDKNSHNILRWFKYLTTSFMPMLVVWSNLLLGNLFCKLLFTSFSCISIGDLTRHRRRLVRSWECIVMNKEEQRTTGMSERRMGIVKRVQLGNILRRPRD